MQRVLCLLAIMPFAIQALPFVVSPGSWSSREIPTNNREARQAARLAINYLNYLSGSPHQLLEVVEVKKTILKSVPEIGHKYYVEFTARISQTMENIGLCTATVFFQQEKPRPAINVNCSSNKIQKQARDDDYNFYQLMKAQTTPITGEHIPDSFGYIEPQLEPVWNLAILGSSYVIWEKTTENQEYSMAQIRRVKQLLRKDDLIAFDYDIDLHEKPSEEMVPCSLHVVWMSGKSPKVDYSCTEDGSGNKAEEGSAFLGNFNLTSTGIMEPINPTHYPASRAAGVAVNYINYKLGGPNRIYEEQQVTSASKESIAGVGTKYQLTFNIKDFVNEQSPIACTAEVLYYTSDQPPKVTFTLQNEPQNYTATKDKEFYNRMKNVSEPLVAKDIPDKFGEVAPGMEPVRYLSLAAAGYSKWQHSTQNTFYRMTVIERVKQLIRQDHFLEFYFDMLIHDMVSQEMIPWQIVTIWDPTEGLKIKSEKQLPKRNPDENN
ncbi:ovocalyxin-32-like [Mixophyes fleayi]|uniref:ovocalyxin-32-like n=1 Tax=Mixophyes fleayi TaxID=3061075 RepID=UPI003F4DC850